ncbi:MAG: vitamin B12 dependent-methionine synthase activation domain-containing protein [Candidatus Marinimicrobia bacterium]|jgi:hypothetical protein|nr:hypothetical protein [Candidatus Neomarinimicrobiota bacterium]MDP6457351.1 vitamin B12 dependent-methionine synthase activation domain-containing protein [Candidatus Neomarinimicrobiota bacterium]MDP6593789.1 vitamin B12 dependent-methionine synthase activation domain-containing protein [Candidatus Neomarinimicrobiota bacterium]MDP6836444.1 vitamin B12 dependent-methionine synthase activation domain-containing protein [Candidatus Neomarinimicrobiota bacterium]MDP6967346.1 vitamin B12 depend|tara:strand:- start:1476 stop:2195 length:720 start_codon:yes stop_codon:yes gene_type:complete
MNQVLTLETQAVIPTQLDMLKDQGITDVETLADKIMNLTEQAAAIFVDSAAPAGVISELDLKQFGPIYNGEGDNAPDTPLKQILPKSNHLALFALTMGADVSAKINDCFDQNDFALGSMLDTAASLAADNAVGQFEKHFQNHLASTGRLGNQTYVLSYSPGYCGWHIRGQKRLFQHLNPGRIGISLNSSCLMKPLKSVSGVLIAGKKELHLFRPKFPFCKQCTTYSCVDRMKEIRRTMN